MMKQWLQRGQAQQRQAQRAIAALRAQVAQAQANERQARALFEVASTIANADDFYSVCALIAQSAVTHLSFDEVTVYRVDHEQSLLVGVVQTMAAAVILPGWDTRLDEFPHPTQAGSPWSEPQPPQDVQIELAPGQGPLTEFALGDEPYMLLPSDLGVWTGEGACPTGVLRAARAASTAEGRASEGGDAESVLLVQIRMPGEEGPLAGIIRATRWQGEITEQQISLLNSLARLGSVANERARIEQLHSQLISSVSHELRTPLAAIRAYNEMLLDGDAGPITEEQRLFLSRVEATSLQLNRILDDLLDLSRMRAGELPVRKTPTDVGACVQYIINTCEPEAAKKRISLESRIQPGLPAIETDAGRLSQVLMNLVNNAIKYGNEAGRVVVEAKVQQSGAAAPPHNADYPPGDVPGGPGDLVISVADDGPGIPSEELEKIFDEFHRGSEETDRMTKGAGLGLAIVSRLTRLLGGSVSVNSTLGEGCTFYLRFPVLDGDSRTGEGACPTL